MRSPAQRAKDNFKFSAAVTSFPVIATAVSFGLYKNDTMASAAGAIFTTEIPTVIFGFFAAKRLWKTGHAFGEWRWEVQKEKALYLKYHGNENGPRKKASFTGL